VLSRSICELCYRGSWGPRRWFLSYGRSWGDVGGRSPGGGRAGLLVAGGGRGIAAAGAVSAEWLSFGPGGLVVTVALVYAGRRELRPTPAAVGVW